MKTFRRTKLIAPIIIILWLTLIVGVTTADNPPSTLSTIALSLSTKSVTLGNYLTTSGSVKSSVSGFAPISGVAVTLTYTKPDSTTSTTTITSGTDGAFSANYTPDMAGSWSVTASWAGNVAYLGATSSTETFAVTNNSAGGFPASYLYVIVTIIIIVVAVIAVYLYIKKK
jgi:cobalamin biosynthesis Mg chelatase CobN